MRRPRWHDVVIVVGIVGLFSVGVWALWWDDVRGLWAPDKDRTVEVVPQT